LFFYLFLRIFRFSNCKETYKYLEKEIFFRKNNVISCFNLYCRVFLLAKKCRLVKRDLFTVFRIYENFSSASAGLLGVVPFSLGPSHVLPLKCFE